MACRHQGKKVAGVIITFKQPRPRESPFCQHSKFTLKDSVLTLTPEKSIHRTQMSFPLPLGTPRKQICFSISTAP